MYLEAAHGYYDAPFAGLDRYIDVIDTIRPMNVHTEFWRDFIGERNPRDPEDNIDIAAQLLRRIVDRLETPTVAKVATIYNSLGRERVSEYGVDVAAYYNQRIWEQGPQSIQDVMPGVP